MTDLLANLEVSKPCDAKWSEMVGTGAARHCNLCEKHVYNVSQMTEAQVVDLIQSTEGTVCMRLFRRADGTVKTSDCHSQMHAVPTKWPVRLISMFILTIFATLGGTALAFGDSKYFSKVEALVCEYLGIQRHDPDIVMGNVCIPVQPQKNKQ